jgi:hypothetical protein
MLVPGSGLKKDFKDFAIDKTRSDCLLLIRHYRFNFWRSTNLARSLTCSVVNHEITKSNFESTREGSSE